MHKTNSAKFATFTSIWELTKRNMLIFLRNKMTIIFSLMAPMLILAFYILFMSDIQVETVKSMLGDYQLEENLIKNIVNSWLISGVCSISCLTISINCMIVTITDKEKRTIDDFTASPLKPIKLLTSYFISAFLLTFCLCFIVLIVSITYIAITSSISFTFAELMELLLILFLSCLSAVVFTLCIMSNFKSGSTSTAFTGVFSAVIGFLTGAYLPVSILPIGVQNLANLIPGSHSTGLFRNLFISKAMSLLPTDIPASFLTSINETYSLNLHLFGAEMGRSLMYTYLTVSIVVCFIIYVLINYIKARLTK